jgi:hypothetical protein
MDGDLAVMFPRCVFVSLLHHFGQEKKENTIWPFVSKDSCEQRQ